MAVYASSPNEQDTICIQSWSGPRCVSTSLMYAFAQRPDCEVVDEPLYAHYLQLTGASRPYRDQVGILLTQPASSACPLFGGYVWRLQQLAGINTLQHGCGVQHTLALSAISGCPFHVCPDGWGCCAACSVMLRTVHCENCTLPCVHAHFTKLVPAQWYGGMPVFG